MNAYRMLAAAALVLLGALFLCLMAVFLMPGEKWSGAAGEAGPLSYSAWAVMAAVVLLAGLLSVLAVWMVAKPAPCARPPERKSNANKR
jgi:hypothetical protein